MRAVCPTGDEVIVASTDFEWRQAEIRKIVPCRECQANQVRVDADFHYSHFGEVTYGVDERAEVGLLTRNIRLDAEMQPDCYAYNDKEAENCDIFKRDTFGGHVKFVRDSWARVQGVQLSHMGQQAVLATYPLHFHLADDVPGQYLRNNVIRDSNSRCVTIHGTDHLEVSNNVCVYHLGHGIFLEDSAEQNNTIHRNLIIGTQYGTLLFTDRDVDWCRERAFCGLLSSYWITHPRNFFTENVAAGSESFGMVLAFADRPLGPSFDRQVERGLYEEMSTRYTKVAQFSKNVMHSNKHGGLWFDNRLSYGQIDMHRFVPENGKLGLNQYTPREPNNINGTIVETYLSELTMYKNDERNSWVRCGNIVIMNSSFADSPTSYVAAHSGEDPTSCDVRNSLFIGETDNKGEPWSYTFHLPEFSHLPKSQRPSHQFDRSISKMRPYTTVNYFSKPISLRHYCKVDNQFRVMDGNASTPYWTVFDGTMNINFRDYDGSLTGRSEVQIVDDRPYFTTDRCRSMPDWGLAICPYRYFMLVVRGRTGVLMSKYKGRSPVFIRRDDAPQDVYSQKGAQSERQTAEEIGVFFLVQSDPIEISVRAIMV
ncbi:transmembrane protein 2-like [Elysia marginata]|uniref:Transmembrane protein 2-like n=1 Tax=Elysia marginata TaxID=1093978 RepID=A0AAV4JRG6_9GAST|nr:transmembrane protein 2-like [Elysia marginata]